MTSLAATTIKRVALAAAVLWSAASGIAIAGFIGLLLLGGSFSVVTTASMSPGLGVDSLVITMPSDPRDLSADDVILFRNRADDVVMHRIVETIDHVGVRRFRTQGDANPAPDRELVHEERVEGRLVASVPKLGAVARDTGSPSGVMFLGLLVAPPMLLAWRGSAGRVKRLAKADRLAPSWLAPTS